MLHRSLARSYEQLKIIRAGDLNLKKKFNCLCHEESLIIGTLLLHVVSSAFSCKIKLWISFWGYCFKFLFFPKLRIMRKWSSLVHKHTDKWAKQFRVSQVSFKIFSLSSRFSWAQCWNIHQFSTLSSLKIVLKCFTR